MWILKCPNGNNCSSIKQTFSEDDRYFFSGDAEFPSVRDDISGFRQDFGLDYL